MLKKLKLTNLSETEMKKVKGGHAYEVRVYPTRSYGCGCYYAGSGGSSSGDNLRANDWGNLWS